MAVPTVTASLNKPSYRPGETMVLTVTYGDTDTKRMTVTITVADSDGNTSPPATLTAVIDPVTVEVTDDGDRTWTKTSDTGSVAVFQAVA